MDVQVRNCLASGRAIVDADVIAVGLVSFFDQLLRFVEKGQQSCAFGRCRVKEGADMAFRDDEGDRVRRGSRP